LLKCQYLSYDYAVACHHRDGATISKEIQMNRLAKVATEQQQLVYKGTTLSSASLKNI